MFHLKSVRLTCNPEQELAGSKTQERLTEVCHLLKQSNVLFTKWIVSYNALVLAFASGEIVWLFLDRSYLVVGVYIDRYLLKHKISTPFLDIYHGQNIIVIANAEAFLTVITFKRHETKFKLKYCHNLQIKRVALRDNRRSLTRHLIASDDETIFVIWWQCSAYGPTAWSTPDDPANILVYSQQQDHSNAQLTFNLQSYAWVGSSILKVTLRNDELIVATSESDGLNVTTYNITGGCAKPLSLLQVPLVSRAISISLTSDLSRILILSENRSISLYNPTNCTTYHLTNGILEQGIQVEVNPLDSYFITVDKRGQILAYDLALNVIPANYDEYCSWPPAETVDEVKFVSPSMMLLRMDSEEITLIHLPALDTSGLMSLYLKFDAIDEAINLLKHLDWSEDGKAYACMVKLFNNLVRLPPNAVREEQIQSLLAYFLRLTGRGPRPFRSRVLSLLGKRFFLLLLRQNSMDKARALALDLTRLGANRPNSGVFQKVTSSSETSAFEFV